MKTGPGVPTKTKEPTRRSMLGLSDPKSKGELVPTKEPVAPTDPGRRAVDVMMSKPRTRREAMETGRNAVAAARTVGKIKSKMGDVKMPVAPKPTPDAPKSIPVYTDTLKNVRDAWESVGHAFSDKDAKYMAKDANRRGGSGGKIRKMEHGVHPELGEGYFVSEDNDAPKPKKAAK
jgi:hypothetical protein